MIELRAAADGPNFLTQVPDLAWRFPGPHELLVLVGDRSLACGERYGLDGTPECLAALSEFGTAVVREC